MSEIAIYLNQLLVNNWQTVATYLVSGAAISAVAEVWIRLRKHDRTGMKELTVGTLTVLTATSDWIIQNYETSPLVSLGHIGPGLFTAAVIAHRLLLNPVVKNAPKLFDSPMFSVWRDAKAYRLQQANATPPDTSNSFL
jgi:hypothetical protein